MLINEREVRGAAGLLFLFGFYGFMVATLTGDASVIRAFGMFFLLDMFIRLFIGAKWSPTIMLASIFVIRQRPEMVGLPQKQFAWGFGFVLAFMSCFGFGWLGLAFSLVGWLCLFCLTLLFLEASFGICVGCWLYRVIKREKPENCPGGVCSPTK